MPLRNDAPRWRDDCVHGRVAASAVAAFVGWAVTRTINLDGTGTLAELAAIALAAAATYALYLAAVLWPNLRRASSLRGLVRFNSGGDGPT